MSLTSMGKNGNSNNNKVEDESKEIQTTNPFIIYLQDGRKLAHGSILVTMTLYLKS
jgi:hypothetical protein